jgi:hypothetical protein
VDAQGTLRLGPGVILKGFDPQSRLSVLDANLIVAGTPGQEVVMTSYHDDAHGGDTNADGSATAPQPGDWRGLILKGTTKAAIEHLRILYGGATNHPALGIQDHASAQISKAEIGFSATDGVYNTSDQPVAISGSAIHDNADFGIDLGPNAAGMTTISANAETQNAKGGLGNNHAPPAPPVAGASPTPPPPTPAMGDMLRTGKKAPIVVPAVITPTATIAMSAMATTVAPTATPTVPAATVVVVPVGPPTGTATPIPTDSPTMTPTDSPTPVPTDSPTVPAATVVVIPIDSATTTPVPSGAAGPGAAETPTGTGSGRL